MDMSYDGTLVLPSSYAVMDEEEMSYVEGGWIGAPNWLVGGVINLAIDCIVVGVCRTAAKYFTGQFKKYGAKKAGLCFSKTLKRKLIAKGIASGVAAGICSIAAAGITVLSWALDPGGSLAAYIDKRDSTGTNGWCTIG